MRSHNRRWRRRIERLGFLITGRLPIKESPGILGEDTPVTESYASRYDPGYPETELVKRMLKTGSLSPDGRAPTVANIVYALHLLR